MKKIISICAIVLSLAIVIAVFTACGKKTDDETTTKPAVDTSSEPVLTVSKTNAMVSYGDGRHQILGYPEGFEDVFDYEYAKEHYDVIDMNFDGVLDVCIAACKTGKDISYYCWLYDAITNSYVYSKELSALKNISVDKENKQILSVVYEGDKEKVDAYKWGEDGFGIVETYGENGNEIPSKVTESIKNNSVGTTKKPASTTTTTTKPNKNNKPTQKPGNSEVNGVTLVEGDFDAGWY